MFWELLGDFKRKLGEGEAVEGMSSVRNCSFGRWEEKLFVQIVKPKILKGNEAHEGR